MVGVLPTGSRLKRKRSDQARKKSSSLRFRAFGSALVVRGEHISHPVFIYVLMSSISGSLKFQG
jgi:hypothetical protein